MTGKLIDGGFISEEESYLLLRDGTVFPVSPTLSMNPEIDEVYAARLIAGALGRWAAAAQFIDQQESYKDAGIEVEDDFDPLFIIRHFAPLPATEQLDSKFDEYETVGREWVRFEAPFAKAIYELAAAKAKDERPTLLPAEAAPLIQAQMDMWRVRWRAEALRVASIRLSVRESEAFDERQAEMMLAQFYDTYWRIQYGPPPEKRDWAMLLNERLSRAGMVASQATFEQILEFLDEEET